MEPKDLNRVRFECFRNGAGAILPFLETHRMLWESHLGWVVPSRFFRCRLPGLTDKLDISDRISKADIETLFVLFCRKCVAVTEQDLGTTHGGLIARLYRIRDAVMPGLSDEAFPIEKHYKPTPVGKSVLGYLFKRSCTRLLIYRIEPSCNIPDDQFDWTLFERRLQSGSGEDESS